MIKVVIAVNGDNEQLTRRQLSRALREFAPDVYRAWTERVEPQSVDQELSRAPRELPLQR